MNMITDPSGLIQGMKRTNPRLYEFIMFRKLHMSSKKVNLHRCLHLNIRLIECLYQVYCSQSVAPRYNVIGFLNDIQNLLGRSQNSARGEQVEVGALTTKMRGHLNGMNFQQLVEYCRVEPSLRSRSDDVRYVSGENEGQMKQLEFIELICRVAFILEMKVKDFLKEVLVKVLAEKHKEIWRVTPDVEGRIHALLPKKMELPTYNELPKLAVDNPIVPRTESPHRNAPDVHQAPNSASANPFNFNLSLGPSTSPPDRASASLPQDHPSTPELPTSSNAERSTLLTDPRAGTLSKMDLWHIKNIYPMTASVKAMLNDISENEESEECEQV